MVIAIVYREEEADQVTHAIETALPRRREVELFWVPLPRGECKDAGRTALKLGNPRSLDAAIFFPGVRPVSCDVAVLVLRNQREVRDRVQVFFRTLRISPDATVARYLNEHWGVADGAVAVERWLEQFSQFKMRWVGERLLRLLDLRSPGDLVRDLGFTTQELSAYDAVVFGKTVPRGKSSDLLTAHLAKAVELDRAKMMSLEEFGSVPLLRGLYVEDGLWSGTEAVRLFGRLQGSEPLADLLNRLTFAFCIRTDVGSARLEHFAAGHGARVRFRAGPGVRVLSAAGLAAQQTGGLFDESGKLANALSSVFPACLDAEVWRSGELVDAERFLRNTGRQLFSAYVEGRAALNKDSFDRGRWPEERLEACALGMDNLGLTSVLGVSVPKGSVPHLWMEGPVSWRGRNRAWKPLFPYSVGIERATPP